ncbi:MAG: hypothetical protein HZB38_05260 [Planctomycetes bacterium]|nr:hypothetical protein [Planctomycetota bacterium]
MNSAPLLILLGRLHPLILHLPIGLFVGLAVLEFVALVRRKPLARDVSLPLAWLTAVTAAMSVASGLILALESSKTSSLVGWHRNLGIAFGVAAIVVAIVRTETTKHGAYRAVLLLAIGLLVPTGHLGGSITHGEEFLTEPLAVLVGEKPSDEPPVRAAPPGTVAHDATAGAAQSQPADATAEAGAADAYWKTIAPLLKEKCGNCHGESRQRGGLGLHSPDAIRAGGKHGSIIEHKVSEPAEIIRRLRLPADEKQHMPPANKPQPDEAEIRVIERWIEAGAPMSAATQDSRATSPPGESPPAATSAPADESSEERNDASGKRDDAPAAAPDAIRALLDRLVHVEPIAEGSKLLRIDFIAATALPDAEMRSLLAPLRENVADLRLAKSPIADEGLAEIAGMPRLRRLDLSGTQITSAGLAHLAKHPALEELLAVGTKADDTAVESLASMPNLRHVYVWRSGVSADAAARLREIRGGSLLVDLGDRADAASLEAEAELKFTSDAPVPGQAAVPEIKPVNSVCPVLGCAVDPRYVIVWKGRAIGFCCDKCAVKFWAAPGVYEVKVK